MKRVGVLLAAGVVMLVGGCIPHLTTSSSSSTIKTTYQTRKKIAVAGQVSWRGNVKGNIKVTATAVPPLMPGAGPEGSVDFGSRWLKSSASGVYALPYNFAELTTVWQEVLVRATGNPPPPMPKLSTHVAQYYLIEVLAPPGWKAVPAQIKVTSSTKKADFVLVPVSASAPVGGKKKP
jgi:hypothetical protein